MIIRKNLKEYLKSLKPLIIFSIFVFLFSILAGYSLAKNSPDLAKSFFEQLKKAFEPIAGGSPISQFFFIFFKNSFTIFITILFGVFFGIFPIFVLYANGDLLGTIFFVSRGEIPLTVFLKATMPHGVIEIPVFILASAIGLDLGRLLILKLVFKKEENIKERFYLAFNFFVKILMPLLILAALIESFLVPKIFTK
jgi:stage II sporulation protein M